MTEHDYLLAWGLYAFAALGCLLVFCKLTGWMWRWLREPLRVLLAVLLLSPTIVDPAKDSFAPAIAISTLDIAFKVGSNAWRAASDLAMYGLFAFVLYAVFVLIRWPLENRARERKRQAEAAAERSRLEDERLEHERLEAAPLTADLDDRYRNRPYTSPVPAGNSRVEPRI